MRLPGLSLQDLSCGKQRTDRSYKIVNERNPMKYYCAQNKVFDKN